MNNNMLSRETVFRIELPVAFEAASERYWDLQDALDFARQSTSSGSNRASQLFAEYSLSDTGSYQSIPPKEMASCTMKLPSSAPCQCIPSGGHQMISPTEIFLGFSP